MGYSFDVYPATSAIPTLAELLDRSTAELHRFFASAGIDARPTINAHRRVPIGDCELADAPAALSAPVNWATGITWFSVGDVPGGTRAYFISDRDELAYRAEYLAGHAPPPRVGAKLVAECAHFDHRWRFLLQYGQTSAARLAFGLIAGSLADLTGGVIDSSDYAWDPARLPARPAEFLRDYLRPEPARDLDVDASWPALVASLAAELGRPDAA